MQYRTTKTVIGSVEPSTLCIAVHYSALGCLANHTNIYLFFSCFAVLLLETIFIAIDRNEILRKITQIQFAALIL